MMDQFGEQWGKKNPMIMKKENIKKLMQNEKYPRHYILLPLLWILYRPHA